MSRLQELENLLKQLLPVDSSITEIIDGDKVTVKCSIDGHPFKAWSRHDNNDYSNEQMSLLKCYESLCFMVREHFEDPTGERSKARAAFVEQWLENIANNVGDANGETIPSVKQVIDKLKKS